MLRKIAAVFMISAAIPLTANAAESALPPDSPVYVKVPAQLTAEWWQWAESIPDEMNPVSDPTGANCAVGQRGRIWFLAGGFGSSKIRRVCTIPSGKAVFFPIINMVYWRSKEGSSFTCEQAKANAMLNNDTALDLFAELDGVPVPDIKQYRISTSKCFNVYERMPMSERPYNGYPSASDGYWLLLKPLKSGHHTLQFGGRYNRNSPNYGRMVQDIEYDLIVR